MRLGAIFLLGSSLFSSVQSEVANGPISWQNDCQACLTQGSSTCVSGQTADKVNFETGYCCAPGARGTCLYEASRSFYCSSLKATAAIKTPITNKNLQEITCPMNDAKCPKDNIILITDSTVKTSSVTWNETMPNAAYDWNCKYKASIEKAAQTTLGASGFLTVRVEAFGFGGTVSVIGQENGKWIDDTTTTPYTATSPAVRVYKDAQFSQKFFFPANWDVFVTFEPTQNYDKKTFTSQSAKFSMYTAYQKTISEGDKAQLYPVYKCWNPELIKYVAPVIDCNDAANKDNDKCIKTCEQDVTQEKCSCADYPKAAKCVVPPNTVAKTCAEDSTQAKCTKTCTEDPTQKFCIFTCAEKVDQKKCDCKINPRLAHCLCPEVNGVRPVKDFQGNCINVEEAWHDKTLFTIGGANITTGTLTVTGIVLIVIGAIVFAVMSFIAFRKRKAIAAGARRASDYVRRQSQKLRQSISGNRPAEGEAKDAPVNQANKDMMMQMQEAPSEQKMKDDGAEKLDKDEMPVQEEHQFGEDQKAQGGDAIDGKEEVAKDIYNN